MKCVKNLEQEYPVVILRVSDDEASRMVDDMLEHWKYVPKKEWKEKVRDSK